MGKKITRDLGKMSFRELLHLIHEMKELKATFELTGRKLNFNLEEVESTNIDFNLEEVESKNIDGRYRLTTTLN